MINEDWDSLTLQQIVQRAVACAERVVDLYSGSESEGDDIRDAIDVARRFVDGDSSVSSTEARSASTKARVATLKSIKAIESYYAGIAAYRTAQSAEAAITATAITSAALEFTHDGATYNPARLFRQDAVNRAQEACESASQAEI